MYAMLSENRNRVSLRQRIKEGETVYGPFIKLPSPQVVEIAGLAGFDFAILDTEHGPLTAETIESMIRAAESAGIAAMVRVWENNPPLINHALDAGARGILVPHVNNGTSAEKAVKAARFQPEGERGICRFVRAAGFSSVDRFRYFREANRNTLLAVMVEGREGIGALDEITGIEGIDVVFIGPYDLSQSLGVPGQVDHPKVVAAIEQVTAKVRARGLALGMFVDVLPAARRWVESGVQFIAYSVDAGLIYDAMAQTVTALKDHVASKKEL